MAWNRRCASRVAVVVLLTTAGGCYGYRLVELPSRSAAERSLGPYSRVTTTNGAVHRLANAVVEGDSVIGYSEASRARVAIAVREVRTVESWAGSASRSVVATIAFVAAGVLAIALLIMVTFDPNSF